MRQVEIDGMQRGHYNGPPQVKTNAVSEVFGWQCYRYTGGWPYFGKCHIMMFMIFIWKMGWFTFAFTSMNITLFVHRESMENTLFLLSIDEHLEVYPICSHTHKCLGYDGRSWDIPWNMAHVVADDLAAITL